jgi:hypothetical protein
MSLLVALFDVSASNWSILLECGRVSGLRTLSFLVG